MKYYPYHLQASGQLNALSPDYRRPGFLIQTDEGGYGCVHTWPELGDATLEEELEALRAGTPLTLGERALECARVDAEARRKGANLFDGLTIPKSHATLPPSVSPATVHLMNQNGFKAGKIQAMPNITATKERLGVLASIAPEWRWVIDFNTSLQPNDALRFWDSLSPYLQEAIFFIEDPCPYSFASWKSLVDAGMPVACDLGSDLRHHQTINSEVPHYRIIKPAREESPEHDGGQYIFTSVMDHPVGQLWAAYNAAVYFKDTPEEEIPTCGLCTHHLFVPSEFSVQLGGLNPRLSTPQGTGLGFDKLLEELEWQPL